MTDAQTILEMIETIDPTDTAKLDEIDARVWCYLRGAKLEEMCGADFFKFSLPEHPETPISRKKIGYYDERYTRSRDALKAIRPEGWFFAVRHEGLGFASPKYDCKASSKQKHIYGPAFKTEELAELYAIIQVIEHERKK